MAVVAAKPVSANPVPTVAEANAANGNVQVMDKPKKERIKLIPYGRRDEDGKLLDKIQTAELPADFNPKVHEAPKRNDFLKLADYFDQKASACEARAIELRKQAEAERTGVGKNTKAKQKKLVTLKEKFEALRAELEAAGVDVNAALAVKA